jgi:hypothetical protein
MPQQLGTVPFVSIAEIATQCGGVVTLATSSTTKTTSANMHRK